MHSVPRRSRNIETIKAKHEKEAVKIKEYRELQEKIFCKRKNHDFSTCAFELTSQILIINPEFYTIWNYRREILQLGPDYDLKNNVTNNIPLNEKQLSILENELRFVEARLQQLPKVYWIWNHRIWVLELSPKTANWKRELALVSLVLKTDPRNFHGWQYRRYIIAKIETVFGKSLVKSEFDFTTSKINSNFSNFSAWHNRTKLLPRLLIEENKLQDLELFKQELEFVRQATFTDPDDQSAWIYQKWILQENPFKIAKEDLSHQVKIEIDNINTLLDEEPDSKWCIDALIQYRVLLSTLTNDNFTKENISSLEKLCQIDKLRINRYKDEIKSL